MEVGVEVEAVGWGAVGGGGFLVSGHGLRYGVWRPHVPDLPL